MKLHTIVYTIYCCLQGHAGLSGENGKDGEPGEKVCERVKTENYLVNEVPS